MHKRKLSLENLTVMEASPPEVVRIAAATGYDYVSLLVHSPAATVPPPALLKDVGLQNEVAAEMKRTGVRMLSLACFNLTPSTDIQSYRGALKLGNELGATKASVIIWENDDEQDVTRKFSELCALAAEYGITINIEFMAFSRSMPSLEHAVALIERSGASNGALNLDMLHLMRTGGTVEKVARLDPSLIGHVQLCDGPLKPPGNQQQEAGAERMPPGEGEFPIRDLLEALPRETVIGVEVAQQSLMNEGIGPLERAARLKRAVEQYWQL